MKATIYGAFRYRIEEKLQRFERRYQEEESRWEKSLVKYSCNGSLKIKVVALLL